MKAKLLPTGNILCELAPRHPNYRTLRALIERARKRYGADDIAAAAERVHTSPTEAQKEAGNYRKGHVRLHGLDITIENPKGSVRSGEGKDGPWSVTMKSHYGYIKRTESEADGDHIDVFIGPQPESEIVFVVDQLDADGAFDEHKVMVGYLSAKQAKTAYLANYSEGWIGFGAITPLTMGAFKAWLEDGNTAGPIGDQAGSYAAENEPSLMEILHRLRMRPDKELMRRLDVLFRRYPDLRELVHPADLVMLARYRMQLGISEAGLAAAGAYAKDASGHEHKGPGPGGGQFTSEGDGGGAKNKRVEVEGKLVDVEVNPSKEGLLRWLTRPGRQMEGNTRPGYQLKAVVDEQGNVFAWEALDGDGEEFHHNDVYCAMGGTTQLPFENRFEIVLQDGQVVFNTHIGKDSSPKIADAAQKAGVLAFSAEPPSANNFPGFLVDETIGPCL